MSDSPRAGESATIPVILVAGYLGAGKTTWLNARLRQGADPGTLVLVNDFGTINVDAELIEYQGDRLLQLSNGCLCCSLSDELGTQLSRISRWPTPPTALIIETSGVARPRRIADMIRVARRYHLERIVTLVDLSTLEQRLEDSRVGDLVGSQIASATQLSANRGERLAPQALERAMQRLDALAPHLATPPSPATDAETTFSPSPSFHSPPRATLHPRRVEAEPEWQRFAVDLPPSLSLRRLEALLAEHAGALARAKGFVESDGRHYVFQWSGGHASWTPTAKRPRHASQLVGIGFRSESFDALIQALEFLA